MSDRRKFELAESQLVSTAPRLARRAAMLAVAAAMLVAAVPTVAAAVEPPGAVYTMSNRSNGNSVIVFNRNDNGSLTSAGAFNTRGRGSGGSLGNQSGVVLDEANRLLLAVNAGSNDITVFRVVADELEFVQRIGSNGVRPVSLALFGDLLYVLHAGGDVGNADSVTGFRLQPDDTLVPLPNSTRPLSGPVTAPAQVGFRDDGQVLVVTEKATNRILTFEVLPNGRLANRRITNSAAPTPFGFAFGFRNQLLVSEAAAGAPSGGSVSSYLSLGDDPLELISGAVPNTGTATCWVVVTNDGRLAFVTNTGNGTISSYDVGFDGTLSLREAIAARTGAVTSGPLDLDLTNDGQFLYALARTGGQIRGFRVGPGGSLTPVETIPIPTSANGLASR